MLVASAKPTQGELSHSCNSGRASPDTTKPLFLGWWIITRVTESSTKVWSLNGDRPCARVGVQPHRRLRTTLGWWNAETDSALVYVFNEVTKAAVASPLRGAAPAESRRPPPTALPPRGQAKWRQAWARPATGRSPHPPAPGPMEWMGYK